MTLVTRASSLGVSGVKEDEEKDVESFIVTSTTSSVGESDHHSLNGYEEDKNKLQMIQKNGSLQKEHLIQDEDDEQVQDTINSIEKQESIDTNPVKQSTQEEEEQPQSDSVPKKFFDCPFFSCRNANCISHIWRCDLIDDCGDSSDEENCSNRFCNTTSEFRCQSGMCIPKSWMCDWIKDCPHGDDEVDC